MDCFEQTEKNTVYKIEKYDGLNNKWELNNYEHKNFESAKEYYYNNTNFQLTKEQEKNSNFTVYRILEIKTTTKPVLTNTKQLKIEKNNIIRLRKQGRI